MIFTNIIYFWRIEKSITYFNPRSNFYTFLIIFSTTTNNVVKALHIFNVLIFPINFSKNFPSSNFDTFLIIAVIGYLCSAFKSFTNLHPITNFKSLTSFIIRSSSSNVCYNFQAYIYLYSLRSISFDKIFHLPTFIPFLYVPL